MSRDKWSTTKPGANALTEPIGWANQLATVERHSQVQPLAWLVYNMTHHAGNTGAWTMHVGADLGLVLPLAVFMNCVSMIL